MATLPDDGTVLPITRWGESVMHATCREVTDFGDDLQRLVADMVATMRAAEGVGLAATQVGVDLQVFVFSCPDDDEVWHEGVVCNPRLELPSVADRRLDDGDEGCLSFPGAFAPCPRPDHATVHGVDQHGAPVTYDGTGLLARCLQHETDHVFGTVFGDRLPTKARKRLSKDAAAVADEYPDGWPATDA